MEWKVKDLNLSLAFYLDFINSSHPKKMEFSLLKNSNRLFDEKKFNKPSEPYRKAPVLSYMKKSIH
jgi:hypothetical protein